MEERVEIRIYDGDTNDLYRPEDIIFCDCTRKIQIVRKSMHRSYAGYVYDIDKDYIYLIDGAKGYRVFPRADLMGWRYCEEE